ncbi:peptidoglycan DD-metalloendopeptidase family protein [Arthrobacter sp. MYb227]|uniref:peptidoglycan DD-metalloendopeptidase family protein n=1 Tax=Arthrobacter sp. MYb227 TaxID=1848601 RepID=UPI0015E397EE|nr:peptidoglycan DD-metalloendopeptidase family protein [Arthrobacter sp. MYb227]
MKKHQVNRVSGRYAKKRHKRTSKRVAALGVGISAALALTGAPGLGATALQSVHSESQPEQLMAVSYVEPVSVALLSGVDAINWESLEFTSTSLEQELSERTKSIVGLRSNQGLRNEQDTSTTVPGQSNGLETTFIARRASFPLGQSAGALSALPGNLQLIHPVSSRHITSPYGWRNNPTGSGTQIHIGQDYSIACGSPVVATEDGTVIQSAWAGHSGMRVTIDHGNSVRTGYSHNSKLIAKVGDVVKQGQLIALSGTTGNSTGCHVHFEVIINGKWNDPRNFLPAIPGQPNPFINSRNTTITAEPIRNAGRPRPGTQGIYDLELVIPTKPKDKVEPTHQNSESPAKVHAEKPEPTRVEKPETPKVKPPKSEVVAPAKPHKPKPVKPAEHKPTPTPVAKPSDKPVPEPKPIPKPIPVVKPSDKPVPEVKPSPKPTPESSPSPESATPTVAPPKTTKAPSAETKATTQQQHAATPTDKAAAGSSAASVAPKNQQVPAPSSQTPSKVAQKQVSQAPKLEKKKEAAADQALETKMALKTAKAAPLSITADQMEAPAAEAAKQAVTGPDSQDPADLLAHDPATPEKPAAKSVEAKTIQGPAAKDSESKE